MIVPLWINSDRIDKTSVRESEVQAVAEHWVSDAGWSVVGVTATGGQVLVEATGPNPAPGLALLPRRDLNAAGLQGLDVRVNLVPGQLPAPARIRAAEAGPGAGALPRVGQERVMVVAGPVEDGNRELGNFDEGPRQVVQRLRDHDVGTLTEKPQRLPAVRQPTTHDVDLLHPARRG